MVQPWCSPTMIIFMDEAVDPSWVSPSEAHLGWLEESESTEVDEAGHVVTLNI